MNTTLKTAIILTATISQWAFAETPNLSIGINEQSESYQLNLEKADSTARIQKSEDLKTWSETNLVTHNNLHWALAQDNVGESAYFRATSETTAAEDTTMSITQGVATTVIENLYPQGQRIAGVGTITATDGTVWTVPAETQYQAGNFASDLYNSDNGVTPNSLADVDIDSVPIVEIDADGDVITGYIFADNYFELYVNGTPVAVDPIPFTQFNSNIVRFRAKAPITYAFKLVDWEENLGLGSESNRGNAYHPGDAGLIASFSDGTLTSADWKAQVYYISPIDDLDHFVLQSDGTRDSSAADDTTGSANSYALHWAVPDAWYSPDFDDSAWPNATPFSNATVGVNNKPSYTNFDAQFAGAGATFIWTSNLVLDNEVLVRYTTSD